MLTLKKHQGIKLSQGFSVSLSKEFVFVLSIVIGIHLFSFILIDFKPNSHSLPEKKTLFLTISYEDDTENLHQEHPLETMSKKFIIDSFSRVKPKVHHLGKLFSRSSYFKEPPSSLQAWLDALSPKPQFTSLPRHYPEVDCRLIGRHQELRFKPDMAPLKAWSANAARFQCLYEIGIEGKSGSVVFKRLITEQIPSDIAHRAEDHLSSLQFPKSEHFMIKTYAELTVTKEVP